MNNIGNNNVGNSRIAKNTILLYIRLAIVLIVSLYTSRIVLSTMGVIDYGIYNVVAGFVSMFTLLSSSLTNSVRRFYNYEIGKSGTSGMQPIFITSIYIQIIIAVIILLLAETVGLWYINNKLVFPPERYEAVMVVYQAAVFSLLFIVIQIPFSAAIIARERVNYYAVVSIIDVSLKLLIAFITPSFGKDNLIVYGILIAGISVINFLLYYFYSKHVFPELCYKKLFDKVLFVRMLKFSGWSAVTGFSSTVMDQGINMLMNAFFGPVINAARAIAYQVKGALLGFVMNITTASSPQLTESYSSGNIERAKKLMFTISKFIFLSFYVVTIPILYEIDFVLAIWLGDNVPDYTSIFLILVLITALVDILVIPMNILVSAVGDIGLFNGTCGLLGLSWIPIAYIALRIGAHPEHVLLLGLCISLITLVCAIIIMQKKTNVRIGEYLNKVLFPLVITVLITCFIPYFIKLSFAQSTLRLLIVIITAITTIVITGMYISLDKQERSFVLSLVSRFKIVQKLRNINNSDH